jgi:hypothetical protein
MVCDVCVSSAVFWCEMKVLIGVAVLVAITLEASACSGGHRLSASLQKRVAAMARENAGSLGDASVKKTQVYGPATRVTLLEALSGHRVSKSADEPKARFYLIVLQGHFVCRWCPRPPGAASPRGTIATQLWSPTAGYGELGLRDKGLPASISRLGKPTVMSLG